MNVLIITGGTFQKDFAIKYLQNRSYQMVITADGGLGYARDSGIVVDRILGDFDTLDPSILEEYKANGYLIEEFPAEKDYTDTHLALMRAFETGAERITILGGTGTRFDHSMANIGLLKLAADRGVACEIVDANNRIRMIMDQVVLTKEEQWGKYVSLIPYTEKVTGITLEGFKYPLTDAELTIGISRGISNELSQESGTIVIQEGCLLVIESRD